MFKAHYKYQSIFIIIIVIIIIIIISCPFSNKISGGFSKLEEGATKYEWNFQILRNIPPTAPLLLTA